MIHANILKRQADEDGLAASAAAMPLSLQRLAYPVYVPKATLDVASSITGG